MFVLVVIALFGFFLVKPRPRWKEEVIGTCIEDYDDG